MRPVGTLRLLAALLIAVDAEAAHPLLTEDTGTQGAGNFQLELTYEHYHDDDGARSSVKRSGAVLSYGVRDDLDVIASLPYAWLDTDAPEGARHVQGVGDAGLDLKWRFYEHEALSVALKPGVTFATGDWEEELGAGRPRASAYLVATIEPKPWALHLHLGYLWNANRLGERTDLWHASVGGWVWLAKDWRLVTDLGSIRATDPEDATNPAFATAGIIHTPRPDLDIDLGVRRGLNTPETDYALLAGVTLRF